MSRTFRLPYGDMTDDVEEYAATWEELAAPIEKLAGVTLYAFDPGFQFLDREGTHDVVALPLWFVKRLAANSEDMQ